MKELPLPQTKGEMSLEQAIEQRRSVRSFRPHALSDRDLSQLLWAAQGITDTSRKLRAAPSAGATYPLETYVVTADAIYRYDVDKHALRAVEKGDHRPALARAALGQGCVRTAPAIIVFTAVPARTTVRYGNRGLRYIHMEAGHSAQNVHLQAAALGLGSVPVGAFDDERVSEVLGCSGKEEPLYIVPVGVPR
ncbi:MAG: SagB/ThcOx family dehydrogenase [Chitinivibrionales bacterium]|nr:SagB/ThcOx family dehydrogenase [Chitinivibrionales bacterium]MBD3394804.1 SagB/ThcOx family dehydrogenase [Chitinivibrionales bacterium]